MRRTLWLSGALVLSVSACGGGSHHAASPTTVRLTAPSASTSNAPTPPASTTTTVPDAVNIPATIDVPYVNAVLAQLNHVYGNAQRIEIATKFLPPSIPPLLRAIFGDPQYARELNVFSQALQGNTLDGFKLDPPDPISTVTALTHGQAACIEAAVSTVDNAQKTGTAEPLALYVVLRPKLPANDPRRVNRTPWEIAYDLTQQPIGTDAC